MIARGGGGISKRNEHGDCEGADHRRDDGENRSMRLDERIFRRRGYRISLRASQPPSDLHGFTDGTGRGRWRRGGSIKRGAAKTKLRQQSR